MSQDEINRSYGKITMADRVKLIKIYSEGGKTIKAAADELGIKASTARAILKKYHKDGAVF